MIPVTFYYKTPRKDIADGFRQDEIDMARIEAEGEKFAKIFGARPLYTKGFDGHFAGIMFDKDHPCRYPDIWTKSSPAMPLQVLKSKLHEKAPAGLVTVWQSYKERWEKSWPIAAGTPRESTLLKALQIDPRYLQGQLLVFHLYEGVSYFASSLRIDAMTNGMQETLASEFARIQILLSGGGIEPVSEEQALAGIAAQQKEAANVDQQ